MRILFGGVVLGDDAAQKHISGFAPGFELLTSRAQFVSAVRSRAYPRGNRGRAVSFRVSRQTGSAASGLLLSMQHPELLAARDLLRIEHGTTVLEGALAVLEVCNPVEMIGVRVTFEYRFFCARLVQVEADLENVLRDVDFGASETASGVLCGGAPGLIDESHFDIVSDS